MANRSRAVSISRTAYSNTDVNQGSKNTTSKQKGRESVEGTLRSKIKKAYDFRKHITSQFQKAMNQCIFIRIEGIVLNASGTSYKKRVRQLKFAPGTGGSGHNSHRGSVGSRTSVNRLNESRSTRAVTSTLSSIRERYKDDDPKSRRSKHGSVAFAQDSYRDAHKSSRKSGHRANKSYTPRKSITEIDQEVRKLDGAKNVMFPARDDQPGRSRDGSLYHKVIEDQAKARETKRKEERKKKEKGKESTREKKKLKPLSEASNEDSFKDVISLDSEDIPRLTGANLGPLRVSNSTTFFDVLTADEEYDREYQMAISSNIAYGTMDFLSSLVAPLFSYNLPEIFITRPRDKDEDRTNNTLARSWSWGSDDSSQERSLESSLERSLESSPERSLDSSPEHSLDSSPEPSIASHDLSLPAVAMATYSRLVAELNVQENDPTTMRKSSYIKRKMDRNAHSSISMDNIAPSSITIDQLYLQSPAPQPSPCARRLEYELWKAREQAGGLRRLNSLLKERNHTSTTKTEQKPEDAQTTYRIPIKTIILILPIMLALLIGILSGKYLL